MLPNKKTYRLPLTIARIDKDNSQNQTLEYTNFKHEIIQCKHYNVPVTINVFRKLISEKKTEDAKWTFNRFLYKSGIYSIRNKIFRFFRKLGNVLLP